MDTTKRSRVGRRWPWHIIAPGGMALAVGGLLVANGWAVLSPTVAVRVAPAVLAGGQIDIEPAQLKIERLERTVSSGVTVQAPGWLEPDPYVTACSALADGVVASIEVLEGQAVERGQIVARLVPDDAALALQAAAADVLAAEAQVRLASAEVEAAQRDWDHPIGRKRDIDTAKARAAETEAQLAQLPSLVAAEEATLAGQQEELARAESALRSGAATDIEVIILRKRVEAQAAALQALRDREAILQAQLDREQAEARAATRNFDLRINERRALDIAKAGLAAAQASAQQAQVRQAEAELRLERMVIRSPMDGLVQRRLKSPGDKVMLGMDDMHSAHLVHLYDPAQLQVRVDVPLADAAHVYIGQRCEVVVEVLPDTTFAGEVTRITNEADLQKNTLQIKVRVLDPIPVLRPEMLTRVTFLPSGGKDTSAAADGASASAAHAPVLVPASGLVDQSGAPRIWIVRERRGAAGSAYPVPVQVVSLDGSAARITGEVRPGDLVVLEPGVLSPGVRVRMVMQTSAAEGSS